MSDQKFDISIRSIAGPDEPLWILKATFDEGRTLDERWFAFDLTPRRIWWHKRRILKNAKLLGWL